jgi:CIC family chloride channel protein
MVGMGALVAATTHAPLTAALMLFELTANYRIILPLMLACSLATLIATRLSSVSIYTEKLKKRGIVLSRGREVNILRKIPVSSVPLAEAATVSKDAPLSSLMALLASSTHSRFFLLDENGALSGSIDLVDLRKVIPDQEHLRHVLVAEDVATSQVRPVTPEATLNHVMLEFGRSHVDELPVVDSEGSRNLIGVVRRQDVIARYNREMLKMDMAEEMRRGVEDAASMQTVPLGDRYLLAEIPVPDSMTGMALSETELRSHHRVEVVMIRPLDGDEAVIPEGNQILKKGDQLLVVGDRDAVIKLRKLN